MPGIEGLAGLPRTPARRSGRCGGPLEVGQACKLPTIYISLVMVLKGNLEDGFSKLLNLTRG